MAMGMAQAARIWRRSPMEARMEKNTSDRFSKSSSKFLGEMSNAVSPLAALPVVVVHSHPIQYFAPLYAQLAKRGVQLKVWYCSDESIRGSLDKEFGTAVKWDIPLLEGYNFRFLRNFSWKPSVHKGFWGLIKIGRAHV